MEFGSSRRFTTELWSSKGGLLADISALTQEREFILTRNGAEQYTFQLDLAAFEAYCASINVNAGDILQPYQTDVKLKFDGTYLFCTQVVGASVDAETNDSGVNPETGSYNNTTTLTEYITVTAIGYLNILTDRYYTGSYTNIDSCSIAVDLINQTQLITNGSLGITIPSGQYTTGFLYSPSYSQQNILTELGNLTQIPGALFDLWLDSDKALHTAPLQGSRRNDISIVYGGTGSNVVGFHHDRLGSGALYNQIIGMGSGFGDDQLTSTQNNLPSQINYFLRQQIKTYNNVTSAQQLYADVGGDLAIESQVLEMPQPIVSGALFANGAPLLLAGDRIPFYFPTHPFFKNINGMYFRVEIADYKIDDNDWPYEVTLTTDSYGFIEGQ